MDELEASLRRGALRLPDELETTLRRAARVSRLREPIHIISLGAGVQSSTMAMMAAAGEIKPMPTAAIFADTQAEPAAVYAWLTWLETQLPFPVYRVTAGSLLHEATRLHTSQKSGNVYSRPLIPAFVAKEGGGRALLGRRCTSEFKVRAIFKCQRRLAAGAIRTWREANRDDLRTLDDSERPDPTLFRQVQASAPIVSWIGISADEVERMKPSREPWSRNIWPLVDLGMSRKDCIAWMLAKGYPEPPRSACGICPFHSDDEWARQKEEDPAEFARSVAFELELQRSLAANTGTAKLGGVAYLHSSMRPLSEVVFEARPSHQQVSLFGAECEGLCGV